MQASSFYVQRGGTEFVLEPNEIAEDFDPSGTERLESALDTLYEASSSSLLISPAPVMLYYHGRENAPFLFSGFDLWTWTRADCQALVDFVLGDIWKLQRSGPRASARPGVAAPARSPRSPRATTARPLDPRRMRP